MTGRKMRIRLWTCLGQILKLGTLVLLTFQTNMLRQRIMCKLNLTFCFLKVVHTASPRIVRIIIAGKIALVHNELKKITKNIDFSL